MALHQYSLIANKSLSVESWLLKICIYTNFFLACLTNIKDLIFKQKPDLNDK